MNSSIESSSSGGGGGNRPGRNIGGMRPGVNKLEGKSGLVGGEKGLKPGMKLETPGGGGWGRPLGKGER